MTQSISDFAMLVSLNIRQWSGRKLDRAVTKEVDKSHGATDGGRYNKLLVDKAHLDPIAEVAGVPAAVGVVDPAFALQQPVDHLATVAAAIGQAGIGR